LASVQIPDSSDGNPTNLTLGRSSVTNYNYDDEFRQASAVASSNTMTTFLYDGLGRLRKQLQWSYYSSSTTNGGGGSSSSDLAVVPASAHGGSGWQPVGGTLYIYDGMRVIQERSGANNPTVTYTRGQTVSALNDLPRESGTSLTWGLPRESGTSLAGGGIGGLLARSADYSGGVFSQHDYYHADGQGNITYLADNTQSQAASYAYDPYGNLLSSAGTLATANTYRFSSREYVPTSGLYIYLYRFYNPGTERWPNQDPIQEAGGLNLYGFVGNNPVSIVDLLGLYLHQNLFPINDPLRKNSDKIPFSNTCYSLGGHGDPDRIYGPDGNPISVKHLADDIRNDKRYNPNELVRLISCNTGCGGSGSFAQQLSNELHAPVSAPNNYVWINPDGNIVVAPPLGNDLKNGPDLNHRGQFLLFKPIN
jgi:RHS repeat-associated protein